MNSTEDPISSMGPKRRRHWGLTVLVACHTIYAILGLYNWSPIFQSFPPHSWSDDMVQIAPYMFAAFFLLLLSAWLAWSGRRSGRAALLSVLVLLFLSEVKDLSATAAFMDGRDFDPEAWTVGLWWSAKVAAVWICWLGVNFWYLLRGPNKDFFQRT